MMPWPAQHRCVFHGNVCFFWGVLEWTCFDGFSGGCSKSCSESKPIFHPVWDDDPNRRFLENLGWVEPTKQFFFVKFIWFNWDFKF